MAGQIVETEPGGAKEAVERSTEELFINREISWLEFNWRVLHEALDERTPLMERLKFIAIVDSNLDEFFMKRVGGLKRQAAAGVQVHNADGRSPQSLLNEIRRVVLRMVDEERRCLLDVLLPRLRRLGFNLQTYDQLSSKDRQYVVDYFRRWIFPVLTPLGVDPGHPFPFLSNLSLSLAVRLTTEEDGYERFARVKIPSNLPRWVPLTTPMQWIPIEQIIQNHLEDLFPGMIVNEAHPFRITRNAELERNEEEADDLLDLIAEELRHRRFAPTVRLEVAQQMSPTLLGWLQSALSLEDEDIYPVPGPLKLSDLMELTSVSLPEQKYAPAVIVTHPRLRELDNEDTEKDIFQIIREGDFLVHHPYQSFQTSVLKFLEAAADDPKTLAIKQTLYRTAKNSPIVQALVRASNNGKQVAVLVEIKARFDEANNIEWVKVLENAGVHVTYGLVGLKTHSKIILVVREDDDGLRSYCHIGTGNYHTDTARLYTDLGLFTCNPEIGQDVVHLFNYLTGHSRFKDYKRLLVAPVNMRERFIEMIDREIATHSTRKQGHIIAKMNSLEDTSIIKRLYRASQAGVRIDLIVRGFCCLRPGVPGLSENIHITSIIGRFLEHARIFYFRNGGKEEYYIGSADWMHRNLDYRVEAVTPVLRGDLQRQLRQILDSNLRDQRQTWDLQPDGSYVQRTCAADDPGVQAALMAPPTAVVKKRHK